ncbi:MAG TPA: hypothetical protein VNF07_05450 [Acidimicrobiales bacterium]|nr:hypothetical protein [Acidimicrobiales bacterium]
MSPLGLVTPTSFIGLAVGALLLVALLGIVGAFVVIVIANRADPDPSGRRPYATYLFGASFILVWSALLGSAAVVSSLVQLIGKSTALSLGARHPVGDAVARGVVLGGLILLLSLGALAVHEGRGRRLVGEEEAAAAPAVRVAKGYGAAVCFVSLFVALIALVVGLYALFQLVAPGVFQGRGRIPALRTIIDAGWLLFAAGVILASHLKIAAPALPPAAPATVATTVADAG